MWRTEVFRKRVLTWCQAPKSSSFRVCWQCHLAASWQSVSSAVVMHITHTPTDFDSVYARLGRWRRWMIHRYSTFDDVAAVIDESLWEQHVDEITDDRALMRTAETAVRRHVRQEVRFTTVRQHLKAQPPSTVLESVEERVVESVVARECLDRIDIPVRAWTWLQRHDQSGPISVADECFGRRWAGRVREELAHVA